MRTLRYNKFKPSRGYAPVLFAAATLDARHHDAQSPEIAVSCTVILRGVCYQEALASAHGVVFDRGDPHSG